MVGAGSLASPQVPLDKVRVQAGEEEAWVFIPICLHERHLAFLMLAWYSDLGR